MASEFNLNRAEVVDRNFMRFVQSWRSSSPATESSIPAADLIELLESQMIARHMDIESRNMRARNEGFYTIGSAGHENNAVLGRLTRYTDPAFLHYRSGAFMAERARKVPEIDIVRDTMLSFAASSLDPISGGRHKVWGSLPLNVPPQTSTIASHLPKAVGATWFLKRAAKVDRTDRPDFRDLPEDSIVICSFGDASVNHAAAQTAFNAAGWAASQGLPIPILFVCEDNGIGISVPTPENWIPSSFRCRPGIRYIETDGRGIEQAYVAAQEAIDLCRRDRVPVFLRLQVVRLLGHAGTDAEHGYRTWEEIEAVEAQDPLLDIARLAMSSGVLNQVQILDLYESIRKRVQKAAQHAATAPKLTSADEVMAPLAPCQSASVIEESHQTLPADERKRIWGGKLPEDGPPRHMAALINAGLQDLMLQYPEALIFGEDAGKKGGVYGVTNGLQAKFGRGRVFDTLLDETMILGMAIGAGQMGLLPIPEIQYLAYVHNALDQLRGEACSLQYFSNGQYRNPMVVRIQGWSYQKGFGGHFHNDNSIAALRDIPGIVIGTPARGDDAVKILRTMAALAKVEGRICVIVEPIALYMTRDLQTEKDGGWQFAYPPPGESIPLGEGAIYGEDSNDLTIITFGNGLYLSLKATRTLVEQHGIHARVIDLRWLNPLNETFIIDQAAATGRALIVDESRRTGGLAESILAILQENLGTQIVARRINSLNTFVPLGPAAETVLPSVDDIVHVAHAMCMR